MKIVINYVYLERFDWNLKNTKEIKPRVNFTKYKLLISFHHNSFRIPKGTFPNVSQMSKCPSHWSWMTDVLNEWPVRNIRTNDWIYCCCGSCKELPSWIAINQNKSQKLQYSNCVNSMSSVYTKNDLSPLLSIMKFGNLKCRKWKRF